MALSYPIPPLAPIDNLVDSTIEPLMEESIDLEGLEDTYSLEREFLWN